MNHTQYTQALSLCHIAFLESYKNKDTNTRAITLLHDSLISESDYKHVQEDETFNFNDVVGKLICQICLDKSIVDEEKSYEYATSLFHQIMNE